MDLQALIALIEALKGKSFYDLWEALIKNAFHELPPGRWKLSIDGKSLGKVVTTHHIGLDAVEGAWARWGWTQGGTSRVLNVSSLMPGHLLVNVDGSNENDARVAVTTGDEGNILQIYLIVHVKFSDSTGDHDYRFAGQMQ